MQEQRQRFRFRLPWAAQTTQAPSQRPPFRPAGRAPTQPPPQAPPAPPVSQTRSASPAPSSSRRTSTLSSPTSQVAPKPPSLSALPPHSTSSQPSEKLPLPSIKSQANNRPSSSAEPPPSASQQDQSKPQGFQPLPRPSSESSSETPQPAEAAPVTSKKVDDGRISVDHSQFPSESEERVVKVQEEKTEDQPIKKTITQLLTTASGSGAQTKELRTVAFQAEQKEHKQETLDSTDTKQVNTQSSRFPKVRRADTESHQDSAMPNGERPPLHKEVRNDISKFVHNLAPAHIKEPINEKPVSIVTLAGENRGASMQLGSDYAKKEGSIHIHRGYKAQPDESPESTTDAEESFKGRSKEHMTKKDQAMKAYVNNNAQSINNSIVFDCCVTERNPGVQLLLSQSKAQPNKPNAPAEPPQTSKVEYRVTPAENLTYQPTIRRRCLRGLFMESSDSEPDNPQKPRRHGCRYSCGVKTKDKDIGIL